MIKRNVYSVAEMEIHASSMRVAEKRARWSMEFEARKADSGGRVLEQGAVDPLPINKGVRGPP